MKGLDFMSTREMALSIFNQLSEKQLEGFIAMYSGIFSVQQTPEQSLQKSEYTQAERQKAFEELQAMRKHIPDLNEKAELAAYRDERYGK